MTGLTDLSFLDRIPRWVDGVTSFVIFMILVVSSAGPLISIPVLVILNLAFDGIRKYHARSRDRGSHTPTSPATPVSPA
ncbi:hypothetical protein [Corynebacterium variabile]|uniref:Uncharacterized protein n=2 Tax=Corynebacterium variabile TaxID=1727 RepID=A0A4Y4C5T6_9CORY|nr:hypothetical protein [Corynebacterium variabile]AEK35394.1 hypothetical protein CVAR_0049 [Corynebacterium variabile DSM 44702]MDN6242290.1 hypothetical protein [Corynebacterium variabile]MDN6478008.1 hypothetical protein [Corynebacterium variabile]MDN6618982.1 hypothetical protein [Corynebacterium variabile]MDN6662599.1 hypothetical protein [Corynebacterium variabile]